MDPTSRPRPTPGYRMEVLDDEQLLYSAEQTRILCCNETASLIWRLCDGERSVGEIVALLQAAYPEASDSILEDVATTLAEFAQHGALEFV